MVVANICKNCLSTEWEVGTNRYIVKVNSHCKACGIPYTKNNKLTRLCPDHTLYIDKNGIRRFKVEYMKEYLSPKSN